MSTDLSRRKPHHLTMVLNRGRLAQRCVVKPKYCGQIGRREVLLLDTRLLPALAVTRMPWTRNLTPHRARNREGGNSGKAGGQLREAGGQLREAGGQLRGSLRALTMGPRVAVAVTRMPWTRNLTPHRARNREGGNSGGEGDNSGKAGGQPRGSLWALTMGIRMAVAPTGQNILHNLAPTERESAQLKKMKQPRHQLSRGGEGY